MLQDFANFAVCCTQMGSWGQRRMEIQRKDITIFCTDAYNPKWHQTRMWYNYINWVSHH